jgi:ferrochelatase
MARLDPEPPYRHGTPAQTGVLLVNLGTPEAPTPSAVRRYLKEFLSDPRVVEIPRFVWWPILNLIILNTRPKDSAHRYAQVWTPDGSPLKVHTERQAKLLRGFIGERMKGVPLIVDYAMRYGAPSIPETVARMKAQGCERLLVVPLYPQYSASTTATVFDSVFAALARMRNPPALRTIKHFHDHPGYVQALAQSVRDYWQRSGRPDQLVMSFHGVPRFALDKGDPYHCECHKTGRLLAEALGLGREQYRVTFQSRFGRAEWLKPYTAEVLAELGRQKTRRVDVICPGFVADCLETLEEIALEGKTLFLQAGGAEYHYIPCLNERDDWMQGLTELVVRNLLGWAVTGPTPDELARSRERAIALGARE